MKDCEIVEIQITPPVFETLDEAVDRHLVDWETAILDGDLPEADLEPYINALEQAHGSWDGRTVKITRSNAEKLLSCVKRYIHSYEALFEEQPEQASKVCEALAEGIENASKPSSFFNGVLASLGATTRAFPRRPTATGPKR